jgi:GntR family transcriptional regulator, transcriptional repressor for pyruvate dehydrogenase complex
MDHMPHEHANGASRPKKIAEVVADKIRGAIIRGDLASGDSLPAEAQLIAFFEVSRPTIREAIRILESENLVNVSRGARGGAQIKSPSIEFLSTCFGHLLQAEKTKLSDIYTARCIIEPSAARLAAETRAQEAAAALQAHVDREFKVLDDRPKVAAAVAEFHNLLVRESGNTTLALISSALNAITERHLRMVHRQKDPTESVASRRERSLTGFRSHRKLVRIISSGDGPAAEAHWVEHLRKARDYWLHGFWDSGINILDGESDAAGSMFNLHN